MSQGKGVGELDGSCASTLGTSVGPPDGLIDTIGVGLSEGLVVTGTGGAAQSAGKSASVSTLSHSMADLQQLLIESMFPLVPLPTERHASYNQKDASGQ